MPAGRLVRAAARAAPARWRACRCARCGGGRVQPEPPRGPLEGAPFWLACGAPGRRRRPWACRAGEQLLRVMCVGLLGCALQLWSWGKAVGRSCCRRSCWAWRRARATRGAIPARAQARHRRQLQERLCAPEGPERLPPAQPQRPKAAAAPAPARRLWPARLTWSQLRAAARAAVPDRRAWLGHRVAVRRRPTRLSPRQRPPTRQCRPRC